MRKLGKFFVWPICFTYRPTSAQFSSRENNFWLKIMPFCMYCNFLLTFRSKFSRFPKCVAVQKVTNIRSNVERFLQCPTLWRTMPGARSWNFHTQVWQFLLAPWLLKTLKSLVFELGLVSLEMVSYRIWNESVQEWKYISVLIFSLSCFVP